MASLRDRLFNFLRHTDRVNGDCCIPLRGSVHITSCLLRAVLIDSHGSYFVSPSSSSSSSSSESFIVINVLSTIWFFSSFCFVCDRIKSTTFGVFFPSQIPLIVTRVPKRMVQIALGKVSQSLVVCIYYQILPKIVKQKNNMTSKSFHKKQPSEKG